MRRTRLLSAILASLLSVVSVRLAAADACSCGPLYCLDDPGFPKLLQEKKNALQREGYPEQYIAVVDRQGQCRACIANAPDGFSIVLVYAKGAVVVTKEWDEDSERIAKEQLATGALKEYLIVNSARACTCCAQARDIERRDYDKVLKLNRDTAISCKFDSAARNVRCQ